MRASLIFGCLFGAALLAAGNAQGAVITYDTATTDVLFNGQSSPLTLPQFDPSLGTLQGVTYDVTGGFTFSVSQSAPFSIFPNFNFSKGLTLNGAGLTWKSPGSGQNFDTVINWGPDFGVMLAPGETLTRMATVNFFRLPDLGFSPFIGTGDITAEIGVSEDSDLCYSEDLYAHPQYSMSCRQSGGLDVAVTYDYTPVPEAPAVMLFGLGLLGLAVSRRQGASISFKNATMSR